MDINTGKLVSNSANLLKKLKDNDSNNKITKLDVKEKKDATNRLLNNIQDTEVHDKVFKSKLVKINNQLSNYENDLSKLQYVEQKIDQIETLLQNNDTSKINQILENSYFNKKQVLYDFLDKNKNITDEIINARNIIEETYLRLNKEFKGLEITSQNLISLYSQPNDISLENIKKINLEEIVKSTDLNNLSKKRVLDLIS